jgi:hypothetical protein
VPKIYVNDGWGFQMGPMNLDSIFSAPSDSIFQADGFDDHIDTIPPDSLSQYIGNVYVIKTGDDPRPLRSFIYAKLKILDFTVRNLENHEIDMVFLWAANLSAKTDLTTADLDTFSLDYHVDTLDVSTALPQQHASPQAYRHLGVNSDGFIATAVNGLICLPAAVLASGRKLTVFDQRGRVLGSVEADVMRARGAVFKVKVDGGYSGVVVIR